MSREDYTDEQSLISWLLGMGMPLDQLERLGSDEEGYQTVERILAEVPLSASDIKTMYQTLGRIGQRTDPRFLAAKKWRHGTDVENLTPETISVTRTDPAGNLYGQGYYNTDNSGKIPQGYAKARTKKANERLAQEHRRAWSDAIMRGDDPSNKPPKMADPRGYVYQQNLRPEKVLDLNEPPPLEVRRVFEEIAEDFRHIHGEEPYELTNKLMWGETSTGFARATVDDLWDGVKNSLTDMGATMDEAHEAYDAMTDGIIQAGFDALTHTGGGRTGNDAHQVLIMLDPASRYADSSGLPRLVDQITNFRRVTPPQFPGHEWPMFKQRKRR